MAENIDYAAILADLEAKKAALEQAITAVRAAIAMGAAGQLGDAAAAGAVPTGGVPSLHNGEVPAGAFLGKSIPEAAKLYLAIVKKKQTSKEIAEGLKRGGIESTAKNFFGIVHSILDRTRKAGGGIVKLDRSHWGLADWYPRGVASNPAAAPTKKAKTKKKAVKKASAKGTVEDRAAAALAALDGKQTAPVAAQRSPGAGLSERMLDVLRQNPTRDFSADDISKQVGAHSRVVSMVMAKLVKHKKADRSASGGYHMVSNVRHMPTTAAVV